MLAVAVAPAVAGPAVRSELKVGQDVLFARSGDVLERAAANRVAVTSSSFRLKAEGQDGNWSYDVDYLLEGAYSSRYREVASLMPAGGSRGFLDLDDEITAGSDGALRHRIDRGWVAYSTPSTVIRMGRQALTWGHGTVFHPMDLFNPFAPDATDTSYKPGTDMVYGQYLFDSGADIQFLAIPRKNAAGDFDSGRSSYAVKGLWISGSIETEVVAARDYGERIVGAGATGPIGDALWKADVVVTDARDGGAVVSGVASLADSWNWGDRPVTGFVEYYRNGFGVSDRRPDSALPDRLTERIARGQIFTTARDSLAIGGTVSWTPLLVIAPTLIFDLNDGSRFGIVSVDYNLSDDVSLIAGIQIPAGPRGTEYGGRELAAGAGEFDRPPGRVFVRLEKYF